MFIAPQYAEQTVRIAEDIHFCDEGSHQMLREWNYAPGQMPAKWTKECHRRKGQRRAG